MRNPADIRVLHVDDEPDFAEMAADMIEREDTRFTVETAPSASDGLERLADDDFDCIVSDYDMPGQTGIEFLETVREEYPDLPFILYTGKGSEEVASDAISAGVTDYLQKEGGTDQYAILANRIDNAVERTRVQRERQRQLHAIETAQEGISILDADGRFIYVNGAYADLYGYDPEEMLGEHWGLCYRDKDIPEVREKILSTVAEQGQWQGRTVGQRADGSTFMEDHKVAMTEHSELVCIISDISEQDAFRKKFELVAQASTDAFWDWDPQADEITRSGEYLTQFGYDSDDIREDTDWWREHIHPDDRERVLTALQKAVENPETTYDETYRFRKKDGTYGYLRSRGYVVYDGIGEPDRMVGAHIDITERKKREQELREKGNLLDEIFEQIPTHLFVKDTDGRHVRVSSHLLDSIPPDKEDILGSTDPEVFSSDQAQEAYEDDMRVIETGEPIVNKEEAFSPPEAEWHLTSKVPWYGQDDEIRGVMGVARRITKRKEYELELERQNERLEEFVNVVSHDLRNPLNVATGRLELARQEYDSEYLDDVARAHERMQTLIDELLTLARQQVAVIEAESVALAAVSRQCWHNVETADVTLVTESDQTIRADPSKLKQLLENLFRNAVDHADDDVTVTVGDVDGRDGFYVADDGPGIPADEREHVFEAGYSTAEAGTGFGLNIVQEIVEAHNWEIRVTDSETGGARFEVTDIEVSAE